MRFSWRRKEHVSIPLLSRRGKGWSDQGSNQGSAQALTIEQAQAFLNTQFNSEGIYQGDNPYLANVTVEQMLLRWNNEGLFSPEDYALLRRINLDHVATVIITRKDGGPMFADADDEEHFCDITAFIPQDADMSMTLMQRVAVAEAMQLQPNQAVVHLRLYEGTAYHCAEYLCKYYAYHLRLRYNLPEGPDILNYKIL